MGKKATTGEAPELTTVSSDITMDLDNNMELTPIESVTPTRYAGETSFKTKKETKEIISCLRNETIIVRYIPKESGVVTNPKHTLYGGMAETASRTFTVPLLRSKVFKNVLTDEEKDFLEEYMGLEPGALSVYKKSIPEQGIFNYWENYTVRLIKGDNPFNLADPDNFIRFKVLLTNSDLIAPSLETLQSENKATYQFVVVSEHEEVDQSTKQLNSTMLAYKLLGKLEDNKEVLKFIVEVIDGRPISASSKLEFIRAKAYNIILANPKMFVSVASDKFLDTKVLITKSVERGLISKRGDYYVMSGTGAPLCVEGEEPTLNMAAKYLNLPKYQQVKLSLEARLKETEE